MTYDFITKHEKVKVKKRGGCNSDNLIPMSLRSTEEAKAIQLKGGIARGKQRTAQKTFKELGLMVLALRPNKKTVSKVKEIFPHIDEEDISAKLSVIAKQYEKAFKHGDLSSATFLRDTLGEKPVDEVKTTNETAFSYDRQKAKQFADELRDNLG